jgi:colicin import membrane protein
MAFRKPPADNLPVLDFIPAMAVDAKMSGGGTPNATPPLPRPVTPPPAPAPAPQPQPQVQPKPEPQPEKTLLERIFDRTPPKPEPEPVDVSQDTKVTKPAKPKIEVSHERVKVTASTDDAEARAEARRQARLAEQRRAEAVDSALASLSKNLSSATDVSVPGPGGAAYANYGQIVKSIYYRAWVTPNGVSDDVPSAKVKITIARDGSIISARIISESGSAAVDRSVRDALNRVPSLPAFPEGAPDDQRTFIIDFNLQAARTLG